MGLVLAFSSTMVVIKLLSDKEELDTLHGRIVIGILIMQDILVIMALSALSSLDNLNFFTSAITLLKAVALFIFVILVTRYVLGGLFRFAAKFRELLFLSSITLAFVFSLISFGMGFSISIGAFLAGVALANLPYNYDIIGRIRPLKDFFSTIFFVTLGMQLVPINFNLTYILVFIGIVLLIKPLILMILISLFGYEKRIAFISSISLAQVSEFSLIMVSLGFYTYNIISQEFFSLVVFITIITMLLTSYIMKGDKFLYQHMSKWLTIFEKLNIDKKILGYQGKVKKKDILIIGAHRMGILFVKALKDMKRNFLVLDNNPEIIEELKKDKINSVYGDVTNYDVLDKMKLKNVKLIISTIPSLDDNKFLINYVKENQLRAKVMVHTTHLRDALDLYNMGANYVILPHISTGEAMTALVKKVIKDSTLLKKVKEKHIKHLTSLDHMHY
jgi:Kef-type K+ transport system membrane component KefB